MKPRTIHGWHIIMIVSYGLLLVSLLFAGWAWWEILRPGGWRDEVRVLVAGTATQEAINDYRAGQLRVYALEWQRGRQRFSGERDGDFEVWLPSFYPELGSAHRYSTQQYINYYNRKMRQMYERPDKFETPRPDHSAEPEAEVPGMGPAQ